MHTIHPRLWIGNAFDVRDPRGLFDAGVEAVIDLAIEEPPAQLPREMIYLRFPLRDGGGNKSISLRQAIRSLFDLLESEVPTLIACSAGMSRSPTIAAFALAAHLDQAPDAVVARIGEAKPIDLNGTLWNDTSAAFAQLRLI